MPSVYEELLTERTHREHISLADIQIIMSEVPYEDMLKIIDWGHDDPTFARVASRKASLDEREAEDKAKLEAVRQLMLNCLKPSRCSHEVVKQIFTAPYGKEKDKASLANDAMNYLITHANPSAVSEEKQADMGKTIELVSKQWLTANSSEQAQSKILAWVDSEHPINMPWVMQLIHASPEIFNTDNFFTKPKLGCTTPNHVNTLMRNEKRIHRLLIPLLGTDKDMSYQLLPNSLGACLNAIAETGVVIEQLWPLQQLLPLALGHKYFDQFSALDQSQLSPRHTTHCVVINLLAHHGINLFAALKDFVTTKKAELMGASDSRGYLKFYSQGDKATTKYQKFSALEAALAQDGASDKFYQGFLALKLKADLVKQPIASVLKTLVAKMCSSSWTEGSYFYAIQHAFNQQRGLFPGGASSPAEFETSLTDLLAVNPAYN